MVTGLDVRYLEITMTVLLFAVAVYTILGGMLSVLVTDYLQFIVMSVGLILVTILVLVHTGWSQLVDAVQQHYGAGGFNPFVHPKMGWEYVLFNILLNLAAVLTWQTTIARLLAARDTKTGLGVYKGTSFFFVCRFLIPGIWGIGALATLAPGAIGDNTLHAMPLFIGTVVPAGIMGILIAAMLAADMSTDSSYMIAWSSVIYNDIIAPFRKTSWSEKKGLFWNRTIVALIGVFLLFYGLWYPLKGDLWTYLGVTGTIYLASMSVLLVACCYWKHANSRGAAAAIAVGALIPTTFLILQQLPAMHDFTETVGPYTSGIATYALTAAAMFFGSLSKPEPEQTGVIAI
jgi:SSS family solute:Na+ symporter